MKRLTQKLTAVGLSLMIIGSTPVHAESTLGIYKDETVYGLIDANGSTNKLIVSDYIHSDHRIDKLVDRSNLDEIHNLRSDVLPELDQDKLTWSVDGYELNYQGISHETLPVTTNITYFLNETQIDPTELEGKSGDLKIVIHQDNHVYTEADIMGNKRKVYAPFYTVATLRLETGIYTDVQVNQGKVTNDGSNFLVLGVIAPGMVENFGDLVTLNLQEDLEITAKVDHFKFEPMYLAMSNKLPELDDLALLDQIGQLDASLAEFQDAGNALVKGASDLNDGQTQFFGKFDEAVSGLERYLSSIKLLSSNLIKMEVPVTTLVDGAHSLVSGIDSLASQSLPLTEGFVKFSEGTKRFTEGATALSEKVTQLSGALNALPEKANQLAVASDGLTQGVSSTSNGLNEIANGSNAMLTTMKSFQSTIEVGTDAYKAYEKILNEMEKLNTATTGVNEGLKQVSNKMNTYNDGVTEFAHQTAALANTPEMLTTGAAQLAVASKDLADNAVLLQGGTQQMVGGMTALVDGSKKLESGLVQLNDGVSTLLSKLPELEQASKLLGGGFSALQSASGSILEGGDKLHDGLVQFNHDGIGTLANKLQIEEGKLDEALAIKDALEQLSSENSTFSGAPEGFTTSVNYLLKVTN